MAAELVQETFMRAMKARPAGPEHRALRAWLYRVATNLARDHRRREQLLRFIPFSGLEHGSSGLPDPDGDLIRRALRGLPVEQAATLLLHYDVGFSRLEIAEMDGISEEGVKSRLARGRERFIREFERLGGTDAR